MKVGLTRSDKSVPSLKFGTPLAPRKKGLGKNLMS